MNATKIEKLPEAVERFGNLEISSGRITRFDSIGVNLLDNDDDAVASPHGATQFFLSTK
jgi:hypothetical protein